MTLNIKPETFERLARKAAAQNTSVEAMIDRFAEAESTGVPESDSARQLAALESFTAGMTEWTSTHLPPNHVVDDSRESIYEGRGECRCCSTPLDIN